MGARLKTLFPVFLSIPTFLSFFHTYLKLSSPHPLIRQNRIPLTPLLLILVPSYGRTYLYTAEMGAKKFDAYETEPAGTA